ncbi:BPI2 domain-containing protein, partial [Haematococcus lacustris]
MLIPGLPKAYPHQLISIEVEARSAPQVAFNATTGATIQASYRTSLSVANETLGNPKIATLVANLTIVGQAAQTETLDGWFSVSSD